MTRGELVLVESFSELAEGMTVLEVNCQHCGRSPMVRLGKYHQEVVLMRAPGSWPWSKKEAAFEAHGHGEEPDNPMFLSESDVRERRVFRLLERVKGGASRILETARP